MEPDKTTDVPDCTQLINNTPCGVLIVTEPDFRIVYHNDLFLQFTGYSSADIQNEGFSLLQLFDSSQYHRLHIQISRAKEDEAKRKRYVIYSLPHKSGGHLQCYIYAAPVEHTGQEQESRIQLSIVPELSAWSVPYTSFDTKELFLELFGDFGFGTFEWIIVPDKVYCSEGVYQICEVAHSANIFTLRSVRSMLHPEDRDQVIASVLAVFETGATYNVETRIITPKKNIRYINSIGRIIKDEHGNPLKLVGSVRDITQRRESELALKKHLQELNRSNRQLEEFAYVTSHDLQEPLRKISTFSDRLAEKVTGILDKESVFYLDRIKAAANNMRLLIKNLLDFSRITEGSLSFSQINLAFILKEVIADLELKIGETKAIISSDPLPVITADPLQMRQLFLNLIGNALKFKREDIAPEIRVSCSRLTEEEKAIAGVATVRQYYRIQFSDNGIGFEPEYAARIFQMFQRLHGKTEYPGSGIGLAICKKIVDYHQGIIYAERLPEFGARFTVILPEV